MKIIIMRHGNAVFNGSDRVLSDLGKQEASATAYNLARDYNITKIIASEKTRAQETAAIVKAVTCPQVRIEILKDLNPSGNSQQASSYIEAVTKNTETVLIVSHIPMVSMLYEEFLGSSNGEPNFVTAAAVIVNISQCKTCVEAFVTPKGIKKF